MVARGTPAVRAKGVGTEWAEWLWEEIGGRGLGATGEAGATAESRGSRRRPLHVYLHHGHVGITCVPDKSCRAPFSSDQLVKMFAARNVQSFARGALKSSQVSILH